MRKNKSILRAKAPTEGLNSLKTKKNTEKMIK